jgi:hypothetical protein
MVDDQFGQGRPAFGVIQRGLRNARIPEQPFVAALYQPASRRECDAASNIFAGGPDRLVVCEGMTAIQPIKLVGKGRFRGVGQPRVSDCRQRAAQIVVLIWTDISYPSETQAHVATHLARTCCEGRQQDVLSDCPAPSKRVKVVRHMLMWLPACNNLAAVVAADREPDRQ